MQTTTPRFDPCVRGMALALCLVLSATSAWSRIPRSTAVVAEFKRANPCPATGARRGPCAGWEVDHIIPLCAGGSDSASNLQWLTRLDHRQKTKLDVMQCRRHKSDQVAHGAK